MASYKLKATPDQKRRARKIREQIAQAESFLRDGDEESAEVLTNRIRWEAKNLQKDIELSNLERWMTL